ncbi:MAG TPA: hypothetical protein VHT73_11525, partial [Thermodesulfobacteriota bacterium]|nr:hypothetical protein [Thermodesulfobacteriota bacterium]
MPKKKRPVETIKIEGLTSESVKEFEPREETNQEDSLWEQYFKGSPNLLQFPPQKEDQEEHKDKGPHEKEESSSTPVDTGVSTGVGTPVQQSESSIKKDYRKTPEEFVSLDATHTLSEAKIYSVIYRETVVKGDEPQHFGSSRLMKLTGIRSDKTTRKAIRELIAKKSIVLIDPCPNHPLGPIYQAFHPKDILATRKRANIKIHPQTKKIITEDEPTGVGTGALTRAHTPVTTPVKNTGVTPVENTPVTPVKSTGVPENTPYIYVNKENRDDSSSSNILKKEANNNEVVFDHKSNTVSLYTKYTGNKWNDDDYEYYESVKDVLPDIIEAAIIASVLRSKGPIKSLAGCDGAIREFQEELPPG